MAVYDSKSHSVSSMLTICKVMLKFRECPRAMSWIAPQPLLPKFICWSPITSSISECDLTWKKGLYGSNQVKMESLEWVHPNLIWLVSLQKGEIWIAIYIEERWFEETWAEDSHLQTKERGQEQISLQLSVGVNLADIFILEFQAPELWDSKFLLFKPPVWLLWQL